MIPRAYITEWSSVVPWQTDEQIEQDLIICRALCEIYQDEFLSEKLAFRGGTALHKLYLSPQPRYSEDIDLVQIVGEPIKPVIRRLRERLSFLGDASINQKKDNNTLSFRVAAESDPSIVLRLKIEINCREHFSMMGYFHKPFQVASSWFNGECEITTYRLEELTGSKLRAMYQRKKGRDLFDLYKVLINRKPFDEQEAIACYQRYMELSGGKSPTKRQYLLNLDKKMTDSEFFGDLEALVRPDESFDWQEASEVVRERLIERI